MLKNKHLLEIKNKNKIGHDHQQLNSVLEAMGFWSSTTF